MVKHAATAMFCRALQHNCLETGIIWTWRSHVEAISLLVLNYFPAQTGRYEALVSMTETMAARIRRLSPWPALQGRRQRL